MIFKLKNKLIKVSINKVGNYIVNGQIKNFLELADVKPVQCIKCGDYCMFSILVAKIINGKPYCGKCK